MNLGLGLGIPATVSKRRPEITALLRSFRAAVGTYVDLGEWTPAQDFKIRIIAATTVTANQILLGDNHQTSTYINVSAINITVWHKGAFRNLAHDGLLNDGAFHLVEIEKTGTSLKITLDGSVEQSYTGLPLNWGTMDFSLGDDKNGTANVYFDGTPYLVELIDPANHPVNSRRHTNFSRPDGIVPNELAVTSPQLWVSGQLMLNDGQTWTTLNLGAQTRVKVTKPAEIEVSENGSWLGLGKTELIINTQYLNLRNNSGESLAFTPDVRETTDGVLYNPADGSVQRYMKKGLSWLGPDVKALTMGASWGLNEDDSYTNTGADWSSWLYLGGEAGVNYEIGVTVSNPSSTGLSNGQTTVLTAGYQIVDLAAGSAAPRIGSNGGAAIKIHSVKRKMQIAEGAA